MTVQKEAIEALANPEAYEEEVGQIELKQTHISYVFLTRKFVYKVKKAVNFGFLDFSTLEKRRYFCEKELELNKRLCGDMYLEVVPITKSDLIKIGGKGKVIEYAVRMRRIPEEKIMTRLLEKGKVDIKTIKKLAKIISSFHDNAETNQRISEYGSIPMIEKNWKENFEQTEEFINRTITREIFQIICEKVYSFMKKNKQLFVNRVIDDRVKECHGDIHSGNIFIAEKIYIFDAIEFNERFRYCDVASEIAFLAMDLDFKKRSDLSGFFVDQYVQFSGDTELEKVLNFYKCYRAGVRGKVISFKLNDPNVGIEEKSAAKKEAKAYFELAADYATTL